MINLPPNHETLPVDQVQRVDEACDRFEAAWKAAGTTGLPPRIESFLETIAESDRALSLRELIQLDLHYRKLRNHAIKADDYLERFPALDAAWLAALLVKLSRPKDGESAAPAPVDLAPLFPQLDVLELVGRGGMGLVYKARQKGLDRLVALKVLPWRADRPPEFADRFEREARALARLQHPGIVAVHDSGRVGDWYYLLMEFVEGRNLRQAVRDAWMAEARPGEEPRPAVVNGRVSPGVVVVIAGHICDALHYAHAQGIVHRDVKPENILLSCTGQFKVADFGLAKFLAPGPQDRLLTATDQVLGTWHYMAPEQVERPQQIDRRTDLYALGVVLYELLTGELPLGRFPPPSRKAAIDPKLDAVVLRALARDPAERFQEAGELKAALEAAWNAPQSPGPSQSGPMPEWAGKMLQDMFGGTAAVNVQNFGGVNIVTGETGDSPAHRHLPGRFLLLASALLLAGWVLTTLLWNLGISGLAAAAVAMLLLYIGTIRRSLKHLPEMADRLKKQDTPTRGLRWGLAGCLFLAGCGLLLFTPPLLQDARARERANEVYPLQYEVFGKWSQINIGEWVLPVEAREFFTAALREQLGPAPKEPWTRLALNHRRGTGEEGSSGILMFLLGIAGGLTLLCCSTLAIPGGRTFWSAGVSLSAAVFLPFAVVFEVASLREPAPALRRAAPPSVFGVGHDRLTDVLREWAATTGHDLLGGCEWDLAMPKETQHKRGLLTVHLARRASALERWRMAPGRLMRSGSDLLLLCVSNVADGRTWLLVVPVGYQPSESDEDPASSDLRLRINQLLNDR